MAILVESVSKRGNMKKQPILWLALLLALSILIVGLVSNATINGGSSQKEADFGIYLVAEDIPFSQLASFDIYSVELQNEPIISTDDIITYSVGAHEIMLTDKATNRISKGLVTPFVVCVGSERIYSGTFLPIYSSVVPVGVITIEPCLSSITHSIKISPGFLYSGEDPRSDSRILESLEHAGKLVN